MPVCWGWKGATPGQIALRQTIRQQENGRPIGWVTAIVRYAGLLLTFGSCLLVVGLILVPLTIAGEPRRRMWHDRLADTVVVRAL